MAEVNRLPFEQAVCDIVKCPPELKRPTSEICDTKKKTSLSRMCPHKCENSSRLQPQLNISLSTNYWKTIRQKRKGNMHTFAIWFSSNNILLEEMETWYIGGSQKECKYSCRFKNHQNCNAKIIPKWSRITVWYIKLNCAQLMYVPTNIITLQLTNAAATPMTICILVLQFKGVMRGSAKT